MLKYSEGRKYQTIQFNRKSGIIYFIQNDEIKFIDINDPLF